MRYLTFIHRSPYATWNPLQAWIRQHREVPEEVVLMHLDAMGHHAEVVARGVRVLLQHYGREEVPVRQVHVKNNAYQVWVDAVRETLDASTVPCIVDVTPARTVPKLAVVASMRPVDDHQVLYLDVHKHRYDPKPFTWIPYNLQTIRSLRDEQEEPSYRSVQYLGAPPGIPPMARLAGKKVGVNQYEASVPWESLVVLLNEAGAAGKGQKAEVGVEEFEIKLPALGVTIGRYDLETRRFRLEPWARIRDDLNKARSALPGVWQDEVPRDDFVLEALASSRLLPFADQARYQALLHEVAAETRGPNPGMSLKAIALDTNLFYLEFFTSVTHAARVPMTRIPVVASSVSLEEIRNKMLWRFPDADPPRPLREMDVHHPHEARKAHSAHEEFEMLRTRCRMNVVDHQDGQRGGPGANDANDEAILRDFAYHQKNERQGLLVLSNDRGFVERASLLTPDLRVERVHYGDPETEVAEEADVDQVAYFLHRLALGYGLVSLTGLRVQLFGDHPADSSEEFLHENVRVRLPDTPWCRGFLHELRPRDVLRRILADGGVWL